MSSSSRSRNRSRPKVAWLFWDTIELPRKIHLIKEYNAPKLAGWTVHYLNPVTLPNFISKAAFPKSYDALIPAHKADWIRLYLLRKYGGCWIDMGIIINSKTKFDEIYDKSQKADITVFRTSDNTVKHSSGIEIPKSIDNWLILAPKHSVMIKAWFKEFTHAIDIGMLNYKRKVVAAGIDTSAICKPDDDNTYLTMHLCIQYIIHKRMPILPKILFFRSHDSMLNIQNSCSWKSKCVKKKMLEPAALNLPYIKFTRHERKHVNVAKYITRQNKRPKN
jgi:hypothetical protein